MPRVAFTTLGCKVNQSETETIEGLFKGKGYQVVGFEESADVYVINTCSVTHLGERKSRQLIRRAARSSVGAIIVVTGCYAQISPGEVADIDGVDVVVGTQQRLKIVDLVEEARRSKTKIQAVGDIMAAQQFEDIPLFSAPGRTRAFLKIQEGCTNYCTYCIIPYARGPLRSRPLPSVVSETKKMVAAGFKEIVLTGIHLGAYGRDLEETRDLTDAVRGILAVSEVERLRLSSLESIEVADSLIDLMKNEPRLCRHLHLPLQAGDDQILAAMNRHYTTAEYRELITDIQRQVPDVAITTDIIVGFPGETRENFENMLRFVATMDFARIHIFPYSPRKGTPAAEYPLQVSEEEKKNRVQQLQLLADEKTNAFQSKFLGQTLDVLMEAPGQRLESGLTSNYIRVYVATKENLQGQFRQVKLIKKYLDGVIGEISG